MKSSCARCGAQPGAPHYLVDCADEPQAAPLTPPPTLDEKLQALLDHVAVTLFEHATETGKPLHEADMITLALINLANTVRASARHVVEGLDLERRLALLREQTSEVGGFGVNMLAEVINAMAQSGNQVPPELVSMFEKAATLFKVPSSMPAAFNGTDSMVASPLGAGCAGGACDQCDGIVRSQMGPISGMDPCQCACHRPCDHFYDPDVADGPCLLCQQPRAKGGDAPAPDGSQAP